MKKNIAGTIAITMFFLFIGFSSIAGAEQSAEVTTNEDQREITLPEIVCTAEKSPIKPESSYREFLNEAMESIRASLDRIQLKTIMEEVASILESSHPLK